MEKQLPPKLCPKIILEGTRLTHKTDIAYDSRWLEERLLPLGYCILFCTRTKESFNKAREERLKVSGNPKQYNDLNVFINEQEEFRKVISQSILPHCEVDVSNDDIDSACDKLANWLLENDLLGYRN